MNKSYIGLSVLCVLSLSCFSDRFPNIIVSWSETLEHTRIYDHELCTYFYFFTLLTGSMGARGSVVDWGTILQVKRLPVRVQDEVDFFNLPNPSSCTMALGSTQPLTEMSTRNLPGGKKRPVRRANNLAAIYEPNVWKCGSLNFSQP
jgi:hypothetical protein